MMISSTSYLLTHKGRPDLLRNLKVSIGESKRGVQPVTVASGVLDIFIGISICPVTSNT